MKKKLTNLLVFVITLVVALCIAEYAFRKMIFSKSKAFANLHNPGDYADYLNDDNYWKLYSTFGGEYKPPADPHPLLGWIGDFQRGSLMHNQIGNVRDRRPVLLYGDSYAQCVATERCFQDFLNNDSSFSKGHYLLNYGVGGYGVDQIALLMKNTVHRYKNPLVIFSLMVSDLDRTIMTVRTGQKPYFKLEHDSLVLAGVPIDSNPDNFFKNNPPHFKSYLWRKFLYSKANILPWSWTEKFRYVKEFTDYKVQLNRAILDGVVNELQKSKINFIFVVFHYIEPGNKEFAVDDENNWRDHFLRSYLDEKKIPYIWSKDLIRKDPQYHDNIDKFMILSNGHPTTYLNGLIASRMASQLEEKEALENQDPSYFRRKIESDPNWMKSIEEKAKIRNKSLEEMIEADAQYLVDSKTRDQHIAFSEAGYERRIRKDSVWFAQVSEKALTEKISVEEEIRKNIDYLISQDQPEGMDDQYYETMIRKTIDKIRSSPEWFSKVEAKATKENRPIEEAIRDEAIYATGQQQGLYKLTW